MSTYWDNFFIGLGSGVYAGLALLFSLMFLFGSMGGNQSIVMEARDEIQNEKSQKFYRKIYLSASLFSITLFFYHLFYLQIPSMNDNYYANVTIIWLLLLSIFSFFADGPKLFKYMHPITQ